MKSYDILILGSGPIGASTAYFLMEKGVKNVGMVTEEPADSRAATYRFAGGSLRSFWDDPLKIEMTRETMDFISALDARGIDLSLVKDNYLFLNRGAYVPSLNISSAKLVAWFLGQAQAKGLVVHQKEVVCGIEKIAEGYAVKTDKNDYAAKKILLALGVANAAFMPGVAIWKEKRQLFVLDLPVGPDEAGFPHMIIPVNKGVAYVFIKKMPGGLRFVVGQEDAVAAHDRPEPEDYFSALLDAGLGDRVPFLRKANVQEILWGFDVANKTLCIEERGAALFAANCGSAVRSCVWIGRQVSENLRYPLS